MPMKAQDTRQDDHPVAAARLAAAATGAIFLDRAEILASPILIGRRSLSTGNAGRGSSCRCATFAPPWLSILHHICYI